MPSLSGLGRCPVSSGPLRKIQDRGVFSRRLKPASFKLTLSPLSQAWRLGGLRHASPVPFRVSCFTMSLHPFIATTQRLIACLYRLMELLAFAVRSFLPCASWRTGIKTSSTSSQDLPSAKYRLNSSSRESNDSHKIAG